MRIRAYAIQRPDHLLLHHLNPPASRWIETPTLDMRLAYTPTDPHLIRALTLLRHYEHELDAKIIEIRLTVPAEVAGLVPPENRL